MTATTEVADWARRVALQGVRQRAGIHYTQTWPDRWWGIQHKCSGLQQPRYADCSAYVTWAIWTARRHIRGDVGADILNGASWEHGYTGTLLAHGHQHRAGPSYWYPGRTLVFYGHPVEHVAMFVGNGHVVSHGSEAGPLYLPWDYRDDFAQARAYRV